MVAVKREDVINVASKVSRLLGTLARHEKIAVINFVTVVNRLNEPELAPDAQEKASEPADEIAPA
jgi:hypothetical protein